MSPVNPVTNPNSFYNHSIHVIMQPNGVNYNIVVDYVRFVSAILRNNKKIRIEQTGVSSHNNRHGLLIFVDAYSIH
jgi:hypothetical protein